jgi:hypothetical protein
VKVVVNKVADERISPSYLALKKYINNTLLLEGYRPAASNEKVKQRILDLFKFQRRI